MALGKRWRRVWDDGEEVTYDAWSVGKVHCILPRVVVRGVPDPFNVVLLNARRRDPGRDYFFDLVHRGYDAVRHEASRHPEDAARHGA